MLRVKLYLDFSIDDGLSFETKFWYNYEFVMELGKVLAAVWHLHKAGYWCR